MEFLGGVVVALDEPRVDFDRSFPGSRCLVQTVLLTSIAGKLDSAPMGSPGGYSNKNIESMSLAEFHRRFVYNGRRRKLLVLLLDELAAIEEVSTKMRLLIFGSFITDKEQPGDIDALVSLVGRKEHFREIQKNGVPRRQPDAIDLFTYMSVRFLFTPERILDEFNHNFKNRENHIILTDAVHIEDIENYRERIRKGFRRNQNNPTSSKSKPPPGK